MRSVHSTGFGSIRSLFGVSGPYSFRTLQACFLISKTVPFLPAFRTPRRSTYTLRSRMSTTVRIRSFCTQTRTTYSSPSPFSSSPLSPSSSSATVPRPKAQTQSPLHVQQREQKTIFYTLLLLSLGIITPIIYVMHDQRLSFTEVIDYIMEQFLEMGEYDDDDIRALLPSLETINNNNSSTSNSTKVQTNNKVPLATIILGWEGTLVDIVYHPKAGPMAVPRPGLDKFLLTCAHQSIEIVIWSKEYTSTTVQDQLKHIIQGIIIPQDKDRYDLFNDQLNHHYKEAKAMEFAMAHKENRTPRILPDIDYNERPNYYMKNMLNITAVLGKDHCKTIYPNTNNHNNSSSSSSVSSSSTSSTSTFSHLYQKLRSSQYIRPYQLLIQQRYLTNPVLLMDNDLTLRSFASASTIQNAFVLTLGTWKSPDSVDPHNRVQKEIYRDDPTLLLCSYLFERYVPWKIRKETLQRETNTHTNKGWFQRSPKTREESTTTKSTSSSPPAVTIPSTPSTTASRMNVVDYIQDIIHRSIQNKLKPSTGSPIDDTVGLLGMILKDISDEEDQK